MSSLGLQASRNGHPSPARSTTVAYVLLTIPTSQTAPRCTDPHKPGTRPWEPIFRLRGLWALILPLPTEPARWCRMRKVGLVSLGDVKRLPASLIPDAYRNGRARVGEP